MCPHPEDSIDPCRDWEIVEMELILRDLGVTENRLSRLAEKKTLKTEEMEEKATLEKCAAHLIEERPLRDLELDPEKIKALSGFAFLTLKPELLVLNIDENQTTDDSIPEMGQIERAYPSKRSQNGKSLWKYRNGNGRA